jgi:D-glycero-beta-D-manno-heptose 1-phosphate adenylyltransferase
MTHRASTTPSFESKIVAPKALIERSRALPQKVVFTNGVSLIVALNSDASVKRLGKGDDRPINVLEDRLAVIASLESVSLVTWFEEDTPIARILDARPQVLVKGGDWSVDKIVGAPEVIAWGGEVHSIAFQHERSTTAMLQKIRGSAK